MSFEPCFRRPAPAVARDPEKDGYRVEYDVAIPMRDGVRLATDLYVPLAPGPHPVLLERTPYGKHMSVMVNIGAPQFLVRSGYVVAIQDVRGRYASEGAWYPFADDLGGEASDGHDTVEWLAAQPFSNGKVGVFGGSYAGFNQYTLGRNMPPHLGAMFPRQGPQCMHSEWVYRGGALEFAFLIPRFARRLSAEVLRNREVQFSRKLREPQLDIENRWPLPDHDLFSDPFGWLRDCVSRQEDEAYWAQWDIAAHYASFDRPAYHVASWFDIFCGGTLRNFAGIRARARSEDVRRRHKLVIGPWIHGPFMFQEPEGRLTGEMDCGPAAVWDYRATMRRWFDCWLKGHDDGIRAEPDVRYFVLGLNRWKTAADWPPPFEARSLYFRSSRSGSAGSLNDGSLGWEPEAREGDPARFVHDPDHPTASVGGAALFNLSPHESTTAESWHDLNAQAGSRDQRPIEPSCLTFTSDVLDEDLEIAGPVEAVVFLSSTAIDTDVVVRLCDVYPDGRSLLLCDGIQRARYRESPFRRSLLDPGQVYAIRVDLWATANLFRAGHRIRVVVNSSCYPRFDVNPGTGRSSIDTRERVRAENRIYCGGARPSHIVLPVGPRD